MKIAMIPRYSRHAASTRLRCYAIAEAISRLGLAEVLVRDQDSVGVDFQPDLIVLQKIDNPYLISSMCLTKKRSGYKVVYDVDDIMEPVLKGAVSGVDAITTDTELRAAGIREWFRGPVHVIPDPIDYEDGPPRPNHLFEPFTNSIVWFGNYPNFESVRDMMLFYQRQGYRIGAISDLTPERAKMPGLELITWRLETFPWELRKWSRCVLSHQGADQCKSENKLVAAIYQGVFPAYVWGPAYEALVRKLVGLSDADAQAFVYEKYRADVIARKAMEVYQGL